MSAFYNKPWAPGYALPGYVKKEDPLTRGDAVTTSWLPRGTISSMPPGFNYGGYAVPNYVKKEPVGSQARTTPWLPRGTVMSMKSIKTGVPWKSSAHTLDSNGLGALGSTSPSKSTVGGSDPIKVYGQKAAAVIVQDFQSIPLMDRDKRLKELLGEIDPGLYKRYKREKKQLESAAAKNASQRALAIAFSQGLGQEFIRLGKKGKVPKPALRKGQVPLAALMGFEAQGNNYQDLGGVTSTLKSTLNKIGGFACDVSTHPITPLAAGAIGASQGGPTGAALATTGVGIAAAACASGTGAPGVGFPTSRPMPSWALPAIIGGGALALVLILKK